MSDLSTYGGFKSWLIGILVTIVIALLGTVATDNRRRIGDVELMVRERGPLLESYGARLTALETKTTFQQEEISRRLLRIENKIDALGGRP